MATFVFPGQGSQRVGMAREIVEASPLGAALFRRASAALSLDLVAVCDSPQVNETEYTQPAIVAISVALAQAFSRITDPKVRRRILDLVRTLADENAAESE